MLISSVRQLAMILLIYNLIRVGRNNILKIIKIRLVTEIKHFQPYTPYEICQTTFYDSPLHGIIYLALL